jgi:hypothetical protein
MQVSTLIRSDRTETDGYGSAGQNSLTQTIDRIADNDICEGDYRAKMEEILQGKDKEQAKIRLARFWDWYLSHFESGSKEWHIAQERLFAMLNGVTRGKIWYWLKCVTRKEVAAAGKDKKKA